MGPHKPIAGREFYRQVYALLADASPLAGDCGELCHKACCTLESPESRQLGIYLLPGEETMFTGHEDWLVWEEQRAEHYDFPSSWHGPVFFVHCTSTCPRPQRPMQCRTFPLAPHYLPGGTLTLIWETMPLPYVCPLVKDKWPLRQDFILALGRAWQLLTQEPLIRDLVQWDSRHRYRQGDPVQIVLVIPEVGA
ncbi:MAG: hypothetical protein D9V47_09855 [Clostridia bacterium]|nr:MAG: hypothetical protein D9V47_09855 [Clostridia bacterium]